MIEPRSGRARTAREELTFPEPRVGHDLDLVSLRKDDGEPVVVEDALHLAQEALEGFLLVKRRAERARHAVDRLELVGAATELVAKVLRLRRARLGQLGLAAQPRASQPTTRPIMSITPNGNVIPSASKS